jgi:hypothetical protein
MKQIVIIVCIIIVIAVIVIVEVNSFQLLEGVDVGSVAKVSKVHVG